MTSGARYQRVVTLRVSLIRGLFMLFIRFILDSVDMVSSFSYIAGTLVFCLFRPFFLLLPSSGFFYGEGGSCAFYFYFSFFYRFALMLAPVNSTGSSSSGYFYSSLLSSSTGASSSMILASPKSHILTTSPCPLMRTFAGLRSLCTTLAEWRYLSLNVKVITRRGSGTW